MERSEDQPETGSGPSRKPSRSRWDQRSSETPNEAVVHSQQLNQGFHGEGRLKQCSEGRLNQGFSSLSAIEKKAKLAPVSNQNLKGPPRSALSRQRVWCFFGWVRELIFRLGSFPTRSMILDDHGPLSSTSTPEDIESFAEIHSSRLWDVWSGPDGRTLVGPEGLISRLYPREGPQPIRRAHIPSGNTFLTSLSEGDLSHEASSVPSELSLVSVYPVNLFLPRPLPSIRYEVPGEMRIAPISSFFFRPWLTSLPFENQQSMIDELEVSTSQFGPLFPEESGNAYQCINQPIDAGFDRLFAVLPSTNHIYFIGSSKESDQEQKSDDMTLLCAKAVVKSTALPSGIEILEVIEIKVDMFKSIEANTFIDRLGHEAIWIDIYYKDELSPHKLWIQLYPFQLLDGTDDHSIDSFVTIQPPSARVANLRFAAFHDLLPLPSSVDCSHQIRPVTFLFPPILLGSTKAILSTANCSGPLNIQNLNYPFQGTNDDSHIYSYYKRYMVDDLGLESFQDAALMACVVSSPEGEEEFTGQSVCIYIIEGDMKSSQIGMALITIKWTQLDLLEVSYSAPLNPATFPLRQPVSSDGIRPDRILGIQFIHELNWLIIIFPSLFLVIELGIEDSRIAVHRVQLIDINVDLIARTSGVPIPSSDSYPLSGQYKLTHPSNLQIFTTVFGTQSLVALVSPDDVEEERSNALPGLVTYNFVTGRSSWLTIFDALKATSTKKVIFNGPMKLSISPNGYRLIIHDNRYIQQFHQLYLQKMSYGGLSTSEMTYGHLHPDRRICSLIAQPFRVIQMEPNLSKPEYRALQGVRRSPKGILTRGSCVLTNIKDDVSWMRELSGIPITSVHPQDSNQGTENEGKQLKALASASC